MRFASIAVGIVEYNDKRYAESDMRLRHAVEDARALSRYAAAAGDASDDPSLHRVLSDSQATLQVLRAAVKEAAGHQQLDVFILYLSGHGEAGEASGSGWFCLVDAAPGRPSLSASEIDALLQEVPAAHTIAIIDSCYAESISAGLRSFTKLGSSRSRTVVASARATQRSWEDDSLGRSVFSDVLLRALSTGSQITDTRGFVDVESALLPHLRNQVPVVASALKRGAVQEPVTAGTFAGNLLLPTVTGRSLGRPLTASEAIHAGVRRFLLVTAAIAGIAVLMLELFVYHLAVGANGEIVVRPGLKATFNAQPLHLYASVETGFKLSDLDQRRDREIRRLADGSLWGFRTHVDDGGLRTWFSMLEDDLIRVSAASTKVLARGKDAQFLVEDDHPPTVEAMFLSRLKGVSAAQIGAQIYPNRFEIDLACDADIARILNFTLFSSDSDVFRSDALWWVSTAPASPAESVPRLLSLVKLAAFRAFHRRDADERKSEFDSFATAVLELLRAFHANPEFGKSAVPALSSAAGGWCGLHSSFVLAALNDGKIGLEAEVSLWNKLWTFRRAEQGDSPTYEQAIAAQALGRLAAVRLLLPDQILRLKDEIVSDGADLETELPTHLLLARIAAFQALPVGVVQYLQSKLGPPKEEFDFDRLWAIRTLACNARFLDDQARSTVRDWLRDNSVANRTMSAIHEALGCVALLWPLEKLQQELLFAELSPASRFPPQMTNYRGETVIRHGGEAATVALGKAAQVRPLPPERIGQLATIAIGRTDLDSRDEIIRGLSKRWYVDVSDPVDAVARRLSASASDSLQRGLEIEVASAFVSGLPAPKRGRTVSGLVDKWRAESEPQTRIALARTVGSISTE